MYNHRSSNVPVDVCPALAAVPTFGERFCFDDPALRARLGCTSRIDTDKLDTSICSFVVEHRGQLAPRGISNVFGQHRACEAFHVGVDTDPTEPVNKFAGTFNRAARSDMRLELGESGLVSRSGLGASLASGNSALATAQFSLGLLGQLWSIDFSPVLSATRLERPTSMPTQSGPARLEATTST